MGKVVLNDISKSMSLELDLYINHTLDKKLLGIIKYYGVDLNLKQSSGDNKIYVKAKIPFNDDNVSLFVKVNSTNSLILYDKKLIKYFIKYPRNKNAQTGSNKVGLSSMIKSKRLVKFNQNPHLSKLP